MICTIEKRERERERERESIRLTDKHVDDSDGSCWERMIAVFSSMNRKYFFQLNKNFLDNFFN